MVFYSTKSDEKVFHLPHCKVIRRIRKEHKKQFATLEEARMSGYRMCNCCSPVGVRLRKERKAVDSFCLDNAIFCRLEDGQLQVYAPASKWRIIVNGKTNKLFLYHGNTYQKYEEIPSIVPGYHFQSTRSKTIMGYLEYIIRHDIYRSQQKKKAKLKADSMRNLRKNTRPYQRGKDNRRYNANQLYSVMDNICL